MGKEPTVKRSEDRQKMEIKRERKEIIRKANVFQNSRKVERTTNL